MNYLANFLTGLSLFFGFASIIFSLENHFTFASWAIIISVIFDGLDGQVARINPIPSEFGKQLDSLVDAVSFGIAPSLLGYIFVYRNFMATIALFIYLVCSIVRLAKYNITPGEKLANYFYGLPTTVGGGIIASYILIYRKYTRLPPHVIFLFIVLFLAFMMVSKVRYLNLDGLKQILGKKILPFLAVVLVVFAFLPEISIFALFIFYLTFSPFFVRKIV